MHRDDINLVWVCGAQTAAAVFHYDIHCVLRCQTRLLLNEVSSFAMR